MPVTLRGQWVNYCPVFMVLCKFETYYKLNMCFNHDSSGGLLVR